MKFICTGIRFGLLRLRTIRICPHILRFMGHLSGGFGDIKLSCVLWHKNWRQQQLLISDLECTTLFPRQTGGCEDFKVDVVPHLKQGKAELQSRNVVRLLKFVVNQLAVFSF